MRKRKPPKGKPFKKGQSGNPSGRKAVPPELREAFELGSTEAAELLCTTVRNKKAPLKLRIVAAVEVLNRHLGRPAQAVELGTKAGTPLDGLLSKLDAALESLEPRQLLELAIGKAS